MARLVAVHVVTHETFFGDVFGVLEKLSWELHHEDGVEVGDELLLAPHGLDETFYIVRNVE